MNKQMTLEEIQDAKAYPLKTIRKPITEDQFAEAWAELARKENHTKYRPVKVMSCTEIGKKRRAELLGLIEKHGPMRLHEIIPLTEMGRSNTNRYLSLLMAEGKLTAKGRSNRVYRLAA